MSFLHHHPTLCASLQLATGPEGMGFIYTWLRLSALRQLDWYRNSNYQSKDIAHVQKVITQRAAEKASGADDPLVRLLARLTVSLLPRGGGDGDAIRMGILHIMRDNGIKEGHRPVRQAVGMACLCVVHVCSTCVLVVRTMHRDWVYTTRPPCDDEYDCQCSSAGSGGAIPGAMAPKTAHQHIPRGRGHLPGTVPW